MANQGEMIGLEDYPDYRIQGHWEYYAIAERTARGSNGQPDTWVELPGRFDTSAAALSAIQSMVAERAQLAATTTAPAAGE